MTFILDQFGCPVEIAPGQGDLNRSSTPGPLMPMFSDLSSPFWSGRPISYAKIFATQSWVAICVMRLLTWSVRVPLCVYRRIDEDEVVKLQGWNKNKDLYHPLAAAFLEPWTDGTPAAFTNAFLGPNLVHGNGLMEVQQGRSDAIKFEPVDWRMVMPIRLNDFDPNAEILGWKVAEYGVDTVDKSADEIMHLKWWSPLGRVGISPLEQIRMAINGEDMAQRWANSNLAQGARPNGVVELSPELVGLEPAERQAILDTARMDLRRAYAGPDQAGKLPVLPPGLSWKDAKPTTAVEAELINQRMVHRNEVASIYMVPPPMIGQLERSTFNNIQVLAQMAYTDGLAPPLINIEQLINTFICRKLLREPDLFVGYEFNQILRGDRLKEIQALREAIGIGLMAPNEGRAYLGEKASDAENADKLWMPWNNLQPIDSPPPKKQPGGTGAAAPADTPAAQNGDGEGDSGGSSAEYSDKIAPNMNGASA